MTIHAFDTYKHIKELQATGFDEHQAEVIVKSLLESREYDFSKFATKDDIHILDNKIDSLEEKLNGKATKEDILAVKNEILAAKNDLLKSIIPFLITIMISIFAIFASIIGYLFFK